MYTMLFLGLITVADDLTGSPPAVFNKEQMIAGIENRFSLMKSMRLSYKYDIKAAPGQVVQGTAMHADIKSVRVDPKFLVDYRFPPEFGGRFIDSTDGLTSRKHDVPAGKVTIEEGVDPEIYRFDPLTSLMSIPVSEQDRAWAPPREIDPAHLTEVKGWLPATLTDSRYVVLSKLERIDGILCHVLASSQPETLWYKYYVDAENDFAVLRREMITGPEAVLDRVTFRDWKPAGKTVFPRSAIQEDFKLVAEQEKPLLVSTKRFEVADVMIGELPPTEAEVQLQSGMIVEDMIKKTTYIVPGTPDQRFLRTVKAARLEMGEHFKPVPGFNSSAPIQSSRKYVLLLVNLVFVLILAGVWMLRRHARGKAAGPGTTGLLLALAALLGGTVDGSESPPPVIADTPLAPAELSAASPQGEPSRFTLEWVGERPFFLKEKACGLNATYILLHLYGKEVEYEAIRSRTPITDRGSSLADMADAARSFGVNALAVEAKPSLLNGDYFPFVAHTEPSGEGLGHFFVVLNTRGRFVTVQDPTTQLIQYMERTSFLEMWTGKALLIEQGNSPSHVGRQDKAEWVLWGCLGLLATIGVWQCAKFYAEVGARRPTAQPSPL